MPLSPILMKPAYRHGGQTPWGGDKLREQYHKDAPRMTGESLELSALKGLESRDEQGRTLNELLALYGQRLGGTRYPDAFPLLIKLIDAREQLSVQVHPDDAYAQRKHGKPGKNEAWVILQAEPGSRLVLGLKEGVSRETFQAEAAGSAGIAPLMRELAVTPGESYFIPAGTIHAIGEGILLYEIQQSSDLTYRLYDWGRLDNAGKGRELHLQDSLAVTRLEQRPRNATPSMLSQGANGQAERLLDTPFFRLDRLKGCAGFLLKPNAERFSALTALYNLRLDWGDGSLSMQKGQTALLPAEGYPLEVFGKEALLASPAGT